MKILVIDDSQKHQDSATETLSTHDLTIAPSYNEGCELIREGGWDAVLCDLLMPVDKCETAVGWSLALLAVQNGAKSVVVVTDENHHQNADSAMMDKIKREVFSINESKVWFTNEALRAYGGKDWGAYIDVLMETQVGKTPNTDIYDDELDG